MCVGRVGCVGGGGSQEVHFPRGSWVARLYENFVFAEVNHSPAVFFCYDAQIKFFFNFLIFNFFTSSVVALKH